MVLLAITSIFLSPDPSMIIKKIIWSYNYIYIYGRMNFLIEFRAVFRFRKAKSKRKYQSKQSNKINFAHAFI